MTNGETLTKHISSNRKLLNLVVNEGDILTQVTTYKIPLVYQAIKDQNEFAKSLKSKGYVYRFFQGYLWVFPLKQKENVVKELSELLKKQLGLTNEIEEASINLMDDKVWYPITVKTIKDSLKQLAYNSPNILFQKDHNAIELISTSTTIYEPEISIRVVLGLKINGIYKCNSNNICFSVKEIEEAIQLNRTTGSYQFLLNRREQYLETARKYYRPETEKECINTFLQSHPIQIFISKKNLVFRQILSPKQVKTFQKVKGLVKLDEFF